MALTKVTRSGITDNSINAAKIEDGTVVDADITPGTITTAKLASTLDISSKTVTLPNTSVTNGMLAGSIANAKLANSSITINGAATALGGSVSAGSIAWQSVITSNTTMVAGRGYFVNTTSGAISMTLPSGGTAGDTIAIKDYAGTFATNNLTILRNSHKIQGNTNDSKITTARASIILVYIDATRGWLFTNESNVADLQLTRFTEATGGTVATSGDFKIHSFTGDGNFVVAQTGIAAGGQGGPANVDYLVLAGGGGGGSGIGGAGGGGAGGQRTTFPSPSCNAGAFPITAQTYPITIGAGGTWPTPGTNSIFSTIISAGGGSGGGPCGPAGQNGGSGGGGAGTNHRTAGTGNTPPVSPPQGNNGGTATYSQPNTGCTATQTGGGGGGSGAVGASAPGPSPGPKTAGAGGNGVANSITGSSVTRGGGGGGGAANAPGGANSGNAAGGGSGGGGNGTDSGENGTAGSANLGGGGGGNGYPNPAGSKAGGSGIVIIRYKFQ